MTLDITNATPLQLRRMVAEALGWQSIPQAHGKAVMGFPPQSCESFLIPEWDTGLDYALGLVYEFNERRKAAGEEDAAMQVEIYCNMSGVVFYGIRGYWYGEEKFTFATVDGPCAICRAFLAAIAALEESQREDEVTA